MIVCLAETPRLPLPLSLSLRPVEDQIDAAAATDAIDTRAQAVGTQMLLAELVDSEWSVLFGVAGSLEEELGFEGLLGGVVVGGVVVGGVVVGGVVVGGVPPFQSLPL